MACAESDLPLLAVLGVLSRGRHCGEVLVRNLAKGDGLTRGLRGLYSPLFVEGVLPVPESPARVCSQRPGLGERHVPRGAEAHLTELAGAPVEKHPPPSA